MRVAQRVEELVEGFVILRWYLDADQDAAVVGALVAVMEQADVPAWPHQVQEFHEGAGALGEDEAQQAFVL